MLSLIITFLAVGLTSWVCLHLINLFNR